MCIRDRLIGDLIKRQENVSDGSIAPQGLSPKARRIIEIAVTEANRLGHNYIGTEHFLMGILREYDCAAAKIIRDTGIDLNKMYTEDVYKRQV